MHTESPAVAALDPTALQLIVRTLGLSPEADSSEGDAAADDASVAVTADQAGASAGGSEDAAQTEEQNAASVRKRAGAAAVRKAEAVEAATVARAAPRNRQLLVDWAEGSGKVKLPVRMLHPAWVARKVT